MIQTEEFKIPRATILKSALLTPTFKWVWSLLLIIIVAGVVAAIMFDWRWGLVTAMLILVLAPGVMALLYLSYAMSPRCLPDAFPHTVTFGDEDIIVDATIPPLPPAEEESNEGKQSEDTPVKKMTFKVKYSDIRKSRISLKQLTLYLTGTPPGIIHIPYSSLEKADADYVIKKCQPK